MDRKTFALYILAISVLLGAAGDLLFYEKPLGVSVVIAVLIGVITIYATAALFGKPQHEPLHRLWLLIPLCFFALMIAVRADSLISSLNLMAVLGVGLLWLYHVGAPRAVEDSNTDQHVGAIIQAGTYSTFALFWEAGDGLSLLTRIKLLTRVPVLAVARGAVIAVPVVGVFAVLLIAADAAFASQIDRIVSLFTFEQLEQFGTHAAVIGVIGWFAGGALAYGAARREVFIPKPKDDVEKPKTPPLRLGMIEAVMTLGAVDLLFAAFVVVQVAYFFGGTANIGTLTYAEYARRGFFELVTVAVFSLALVITLEWVTIRSGARDTRLFRILALILVALVGVMLVSASRRMWLYEEAYGFTRLRVYTHVAMLWIGVLFGFFVLGLFRVRRHIFALGILICAIGYLATLNLLNVDLYIAQQNIARVEQGYELDFYYLNGLTADATPAILALYRDPNITPQLREDSGYWLLRTLQRLDRARGDTIFSANIARDQAWETLDPMRDELIRYERYRS